MRRAIRKTRKFPHRVVRERSIILAHTCSPDVGTPCIPCGITPERASKGKALANEPGQRNPQRRR